MALSHARRPRRRPSTRTGRRTETRPHPAKAKAARNLYAAGNSTVADIARAVGVSRATL